MSKKKDKKQKPKLPKPNSQIPTALIRPIKAIGISSALQRAREFPIYGCWFMADWQEAGITPVIVARRQDNDRIMFGDYMIDIFCLGVKDVFTRADYSIQRFERDLPDLCNGAPEPCSVEYAHELIYGAIEYAEKLGFQPHPDFKNQLADLMLDPPDAHPRVNNLSSGKNGRPFFIPGPYDNPVKVASVINTLRRTQGEGNFDTLIIE